jgi:DNA-binding winged helix-turn-helix (wHTH) protein/TolB-like protein/tetratricopeptide (TPR) repeat protein
MSNKTNDLYEFGDFAIDLRRGLLLQRGLPLAVPPKAFDTLLVLAESDGCVLSKEELMNRVWGDTFVEENNLTQQISLLRRLLNDATQSIIETVPRRGYRFAAELRVAATSPAVPAQQDGAGFRKWIRWAIPIVLATVLAAWVLLLVRTPPNDPGTPRRIAVLPFKPLPGVAQDAVLELGMADTLITELSGMRQITVRPTSSILRFTAPADPAEIGKQLEVDAVLDGRIQRVGSRLRVTAQLIRVRDGVPIWAGKFDEDISNILNVQDVISGRIASALMLDLTGEEKRALFHKATPDAEAYQLYLKGRYHWWKWTPSDWSRSRDYFEQAVARDPSYALAWSGLADAIGVQLFVRPPREIAPQSMAAAKRALQLAPDLPDAYAALAALELFYGWNAREAERLIQHSIALNPNHALSHDIYAMTLASAGKFPEALSQSQRAFSLDPTSPYMNTDLGMIHYYRRDFATAAQHVHSALSSDPDYADGLRFLSNIEEAQGHYGSSIEAAARMLAKTGDPDIAAAMRAQFASSGYAGALRAWATGLETKSKRTYVCPLDLAEVYARAGDRLQALNWLEKALSDRSPNMIWLPLEPRWDAYRNEPRFKAAISAMKRPA